MKLSKYIWLFIFLLGIVSMVNAQYINTVCTGDTGVIYKVKGHTGSTFVWNVQGGIITENYGDSVKVNWGGTAGEFTVRVQEFSSHGCPAVPVTGKVLVSGPSLELGDNREICTGESVVINPGNSYFSYLWQDGSTNSTFTTRTSGKIKLIVSNKYGCSASDSLSLIVHRLPRVNLGRDTSLCGTESLILDGGNDGLTYQWSTGEIGREITVYAGKQTVTVKVTDEYNCISNDTIKIRACSTADYFRNMPTAFTPNGDGRNDKWEIPELEAFPNAVVEIYDRWGNLVFKSEPGYSNPWDGYSNGKEMPMDSYYFIIDVGDNLQPVVGTVTLIR